jgi:O-antigen/teichoic acid export membrane protein
MSIAKKVLKNTGYLTIGQIFTLGFGMVWMALFSRYIGPEGLGKYAFAQSNIAIVALFVEVGLQNLVIRNVSRNKSESNLYYNNIIFIKIFLSFIIYSIFLSIIFIFGWEKTTIQIIIAVIITTSLYSINLAAIAIFYAFEQMRYDAIGQIVNSIITFIGVFVGIKLKFSLVEIIYIIAFASAVRLFINIWQLHKVKEFRIKLSINLIKYDFIKRTILESFPFAVLSLISVIYGNIIIIFLRSYTSDQKVGIFSAAQKMNGFLFIVPQMLMSAIFPSLSSIYKKSKEKMAKIYKLTYRIIIIFSFPFTVFIILFAKSIILVVYGEKYLASVLPFQILNLIILNSVGYISGAALNAMGQEKYYTKIFGLTVIMTTGLSFIFIPKLGVIAACLILLLGSFLGFTVYSVKIFKLLKIKYPVLTLTKTIIISLLLLFAILGIKLLSNNLLFQIIISIIVFLGLFFIIKPFETNDVNLLRQILPSQYAVFSRCIIRYIKMK